MPTYEYKCRECGHRFEVVQSFTDAPLRKCEECGGELGKVFGNIGITFKGSGFYRTDSRTSSTAPKAANGKDKADSKGGSKSDSGSSDSGSSGSGSPESGSPKSGTSPKAEPKAGTSKPGESKVGSGSKGKDSSG